MDGVLLSSVSEPQAPAPASAALHARRSGVTVMTGLPDFNVNPGELRSGSPFQHGITDPEFPVEVPQELAGDPRAVEVYQQQYAGRVDRQRCMLIVRANTSAESLDELRNVVTVLTEIQTFNEAKRPSRAHVRPFDLGDIPNDYRVSVTIGFGSTLFIDHTGYDRFGLAALRPRDLQPMPRFPHDVFAPRDSRADFIIVVCSDSTYVNVAVGRYLSDTFDKVYAERFGDTGQRSMFGTRSIEVGFGRPDKREFLRFDDGIDNLRPGEGDEMERLVYVDRSQHEPDWCIGGSYLVYRKIRERMPVWEFGLGDNATAVRVAQEAAIGREKADGRPLSRETVNDDGLTPVYPNPEDPRDGPLDAHVRKVQPRRPTVDLFGRDDLERRFLRRPYPYFDGLDRDGRVHNGLHFLAYMSSIQDQFEHVTNMWQM
ncbi:MAG: Dyp-type peroxidase, partial [Gemmatimonadetes bacterium]|nr:Dyp-type peroxidase [Gemmatimonadota bacterium]